MTNVIEVISFKHDYQYVSDNPDDNKPGSLAFLDEICFDSFSSVFGGRTVDVESLTISEEISTAEKVGKALFLILFAPISIILIICFLIKMAITSSLNEKVKIQRLIGEAEAKIERVSKQFTDEVEAENFAAAKEVYDEHIGTEANKGCLFGQEEIIEQMKNIRKSAIEEKVKTDFLAETKAKMDEHHKESTEQLGIDLDLGVYALIQEALDEGSTPKDITKEKIEEFRKEIRAKMGLDGESVSASSDSEEEEEVVPSTKREFDFVHKAEINALTEALRKTNSFVAISGQLFGEVKALEEVFSRKKSDWDKRLQDLRLKEAESTLVDSEVNETIQACEGEFTVMLNAFDSIFALIDKKFVGIGAKIRPNTSKIRPNTSKIKPNTSKIKPNTSKIKPNTSKIRPNTRLFHPFNEIKETYDTLNGKIQAELEVLLNGFTSLKAEEEAKLEEFHKEILAEIEEDEGSVSASSDSEEEVVPSTKREFDFVHKAELAALIETIKNSSSFGAISRVLFEEVQALDEPFRGKKREWDKRLEELRIWDAGLTLQASELDETIQACEGEFTAQIAALNEIITLMDQKFSGRMADTLKDTFEMTRDGVLEDMEFLMDGFKALKASKDLVV